MKLGQQALEALQAEITGRLKPGEDLVVAGEIGISGTLVLISREKEKLRKYFSESFLYMSTDTLQKCKVSREDDFWMDKRISALYFTEEGGILSGLWKMAEASGVGLDVDLRKIPIRQETIEVCEVFHLNPYQLTSTGAVLVVTPKGEELKEKLTREGIPAEIIGHTTEGNDRIIWGAGEKRFLDRPAPDELTRIYEMKENANA